MKIWKWMINAYITLFLSLMLAWAGWIGYLIFNGAIYVLTP